MKRYMLMLAVILSMGCSVSTINHQTAPRTEAYTNHDPYLDQLRAECERMEARTFRRLSPTFTVYCN